MAGKKITGRTKQLSLKATAEFHQRLKGLASNKNCLMIEILEQALELYEKEAVKKDIEKAASQVLQAKEPQKRVNKRAGQELAKEAKKRKLEESEKDEMEMD